MVQHWVAYHSHILALKEKAALADNLGSRSCLSGRVAQVGCTWKVPGFVEGLLGSHMVDSLGYHLLGIRSWLQSHPDRSFWVVAGLFAWVEKVADPTMDREIVVARVEKAVGVT